MKRELAVERYREATELVGELVDLAGERHYLMQRWLWAIADPERYRADARSAYTEVVRNWNKRTWGYRSRLRLSFGDPIALRYLDYNDDARTRPRSLHYMFVAAHKAILECESDPRHIPEAQRCLDQMNHSWSQFSDDATEELLSRAAGSVRRLGYRPDAMTVSSAPT